MGNREGPLGDIETYLKAGRVAMHVARCWHTPASASTQALSDLRQGAARAGRGAPVGKKLTAWQHVHSVKPRSRLPP